MFCNTVFLISIITASVTVTVTATTNHPYKCQQFSSAFDDNITGHSLRYAINPEDGDLKFGLHEFNSSVVIACNNEKILLEFPVGIDPDTETDTGAGIISLLIAANLTVHGQLRIENEYYEPDEYCVQNITRSKITFEICPPRCGAGKDDRGVLCIPKCCSVGKSLAITNDGPGCEASGPIIWSPTLYSDPHTKLPPVRAPLMHFTQQGPNCTQDAGHSMWPLRDVTLGGELIQEKQIWRVLSDGSIAHLSSSRVWKTLKVSYCIDGMIPDFMTNSSFSGDEADQALLICFEDNPEMDTYSYIYVPAMLIASVFLLLTAVVYGLLWDQHTVHGWTIFTFVVSMLFMYVFLATVHILGKTRTEPEESGSILCTSLGIAAHFFFLSSFCWLTLINVDLFWTFRVLRPDGTGKSKGIRRFALFLIFALLVPVSVIGTGLVLSAEYPDIESEVIVPDYGVSTCFISKTARGPYLYYVIGSLLGCNMALITVTLVTVYRLKTSTRFAKIKSAERSGHSLALFVKLFIIMGATWIFEMISWLATSGARPSSSSNETQQIPIAWIVIDLINVLQAVAIFVIFVCKRKTWTQLQAKYAVFKGWSACVFLPCQSDSGSDNANDTDIRTKTNGMGNMGTSTSMGRLSRKPAQYGFPVHEQNSHNSGRSSPSTTMTTVGISKTTTKAEDPCQ